jgi:putative two-component system response regulator
MGYQILVVDDNDINLLLIEKILQMEGYQVTLANSGQEAMKHICDHFDLAILDVMMPDMDGFELCRNLRKSDTNAGIPVILLTALSGENERKLAKTAGANAILSKPFDMESFKKRVAEYLG